MMVKHSHYGALVWMAAILAMAGSAPVWAATPDPAVDTDDLLEAPPVDTYRYDDMESPSGGDVPPGDIGEVAPDLETPAAAEPGRTVMLFPYYISAYLPVPETTEVNLGLSLSEAPGIDVAAGWGAAEGWMLSAKLSVQGASYTTQLQARVRLLPEEAGQAAPAMAALAGWRNTQQKTLGDNPHNLFRGNRILGGVALSKDLGVLTASLGGNPTLAAFWAHVCLHAQALLEYQTGREQEDETEVSRLVAGTRLAMEILVVPDRWIVVGVFDTLTDWIGRDHVYLGVRYYSDPGFAVDVLGGVIGGGRGATIALTWIF